MTATTWRPQVCVAARALPPHCSMLSSFFVAQAEGLAPPQPVALSLGVGGGTARTASSVR